MLVSEKRRMTRRSLDVLFQPLCEERALVINQSSRSRRRDPRDEASAGKLDQGAHASEDKVHDRDIGVVVLAVEADDGDLAADVEDDCADELDDESEDEDWGERGLGCLPPTKREGLCAAAFVCNASVSGLAFKTHSKTLC